MARDSKLGRLRPEEKLVGPKVDDAELSRVTSAVDRRFETSGTSGTARTVGNNGKTTAELLELFQSNLARVLKVFEERNTDARFAAYLHDFIQRVAKRTGKKPWKKRAKALDQERKSVKKPQHALGVHCQQKMSRNFLGVHCQQKKSYWDCANHRALEKALVAMGFDREDWQVVRGLGVDGITGIHNKVTGLSDNVIKGDIEQVEDFSLSKKEKKVLTKIFNFYLRRKLKTMKRAERREPMEASDT